MNNLETLGEQINKLEKEYLSLSKTVEKRIEYIKDLYKGLDTEIFGPRNDYKKALKAKLFEVPNFDEDD